MILRLEFFSAAPNIQDLFSVSHWEKLGSVAISCKISHLVFSPKVLEKRIL